MGFAGRVSHGLAVIGLSLIVPMASAADIAALNRAGQQRMLSQRIVKAYSQVGLNVLPAAAAGQLSDAVSHFEANLVILDKAAVTPAAKQALANLVDQWKPLRQAALSPVAKTAAVDLNLRADATLQAADRLTQLFQDELSTPTSKLVNLAGRQRMLSQRVAKAYMMQSWGIDSPALRDELAAATSAFTAGLKTLLDASGARPDIVSELDDMALQWEWLQAALAAEGAVSYRLIVAEATESILATADRVTVMYEQTGVTSR
jgi:nitrate/nitrite-specific signal transduction histidine kinase